MKAGQNQADWEKSGWIAAQDPRGWFHWYCRFYMVGVALQTALLLLLVLIFTTTKKDCIFPHLCALLRAWSLCLQSWLMLLVGHLAILKY